MNVSPGNQCQTINQVLKLNPTGKEYMYLIYMWVWWWECGPSYNMIYCMKISLISCYGWYLRSTVNSTCRCSRFSSLYFYTAENGHEKVLINYSLSARNSTVIVPKIWKFPVLVWQFLPFHCYFWWFSWVFGLFLPNLVNIWCIW